MGREPENREDLVQNLKDAGCNQDVINSYLDCSGCGDREGESKLLEHHRRQLLDEMHRCQHKIDCLDYLRYREREKENLSFAPFD